MNMKCSVSCEDTTPVVDSSEVCKLPLESTANSSNSCCILGPFPSCRPMFPKACSAMDARILFMVGLLGCISLRTIGKLYYAIAYQIVSEGVLTKCFIKS